MNSFAIAVMRRASAGTIGILLLLPMFPGAGRGQSPSGGVPVVLISIDGLKPDHVLDADKHGLKVPNMRRLVKEGAYASGVTGVTPTVTYPSHTTILTGVAPARHGILNNQPFDPFNKNMRGWYWYSEDIKVPTLWDAVGKAGRITANVEWPVSVGAEIRYNIVQYWRAATPDDHKLTRALSTKGLLDEAEKDLGPYPTGYAYHFPDDVRRLKFITWMMEKKKPDFITGYVAGLDEQQHATSPYSARTFETLEGIDALIGEARAAAERVYRGRFVLCVVSDHGHITADTELHLNAALTRKGLIELDEQGRVTSWRAFAWNAGGCAGIVLGDEDARRQVRELLSGLSATPENGIERVVEAEDAKALNGFPDAAFIVGLKPGFRTGGGLNGEVTTRGKSGGSHGYLPGHRDMEASFFLMGHGIPAGRRLGKIDMRDIAPTLARILRVPFPSAEGRDLLGNGQPHAR